MMVMMPMGRTRTATVALPIRWLKRLEEQRKKNESEIHLSGERHRTYTQSAGDVALNVVCTAAKRHKLGEALPRWVGGPVGGGDDDADGHRRRERTAWAVD